MSEENNDKSIERKREDEIYTFLLGYAPKLKESLDELEHYSIDMDMNLENLPNIVITTNNKNGVSSMYLFVKLKESHILDEELKLLINSNLRKENSPRHIPNYIFQVNDIPYTLSGKKLELPIKKIFEGSSIEESVSKDIVRNPHSLDNFHSIYESIMSE